MALRLILLGIALLVPLNLPFSLPPLGAEAIVGWSGELHQHGDEEVYVVTRTLRHARVAGLQPGDILREIDGQPASAEALASLSRGVAAGSSVDLVVERSGRSLDIEIPIQAVSISYYVYLFYLLALAVGGWLIGSAIVAWRGSRLSYLLLAGALLLLAPMAFGSGVQGDGWMLAAARNLWQLQSGAYRFLFPALLLHFLVLHFGRREVLRQVWPWSILYLALCGVLAVITVGFQEPVAWTMIGLERDVRTAAGLVIEVLLIGVAWSFRREGPGAASAERWLIYAALCFGGTGLLRSVLQLGMGEHGITHLVTQLNAVTLALFPPLTLVYLLVPEEARRDWWVRRWISPSISIALTCLFGFLITGIVATVLNATQTDLSGVEWTLFFFVFFGTIVFSPLLTWAREAVEQRMWSNWTRREGKIREFIASASAELEPTRVIERLRTELPPLLEADRVDLIIEEDIADRWDLGSSGYVRFVSREVLDQRSKGEHRTPDGFWTPLQQNEGEPAGALWVERRDASASSPPEEALRKLAAEGIATALRYCHAYIELRNSQEELVEAEQLASLGALAVGLAHEIKNPLASLKMGLHLVRRDGTNERRLTRLEGDIHRIDTLVTGLLRFTRPNGAESEQVLDLREMVASCVEDLRAQTLERGVVVLENYADGNLPTRAGRDQLRLIISNLLINSLEAVHEGDLIEVRIEPHGDDAADVFVRDTGPGIPEELQDRIFKQSFTTKSIGTGLGLTIARREAERIGGSLSLVPSTERGTMLRVRIPLAHSVKPVIGRAG